MLSPGQKSYVPGFDAGKKKGNSDKTRRGEFAIPKTHSADSPSQSRHNERLSVSSESVRILFYQLSVLLDSGVNILEALTTLKQSTDNKTLEIALHQICMDIQSGFRFSKSLERYPRIFPKLIVELTRAGEETGRLTTTLRQATDWLERQNQVKRKVVSALSYPVVVGVVALVVNLMVLNFSLPQMEDMLASMQVETPTLTRIVFGFGHLVANPATLGALCILVVTMWSYRRRFFNFQRRLALTRVAHEIPVVGPLLQAAALARIASTLTICIEVNLNLMKALTLSLNSCGNAAYAASLKRILQSVRDGQPLASAFSFFPDLYPPIFCQSLEVGEESGQLPKTMTSLGRLLELEVDSLVDVLGNTVEPVLLGMCAAFVGVFVLATMLPLQEFLTKLMT